MKTGHI